MKHTLSVLLEDETGALSRISGLFARRGFNIESLAVGPAETTGMSRLTMVVEGDTRTLEQMTKQLDKLVNVLRVVDLTEIPAVERELMLLKVSPTWWMWPIQPSRSRWWATRASLWRSSRCSQATESWRSPAPVGSPWSGLPG